MKDSTYLLMRKGMVPIARVSCPPGQSTEAVLDVTRKKLAAGTLDHEPKMNILQMQEALKTATVYTLI